MKKEEIHWADWHRILMGTAPIEFLWEVLIRSIIIYLFLLITLRLLGKRMGGQLTISELAVMLTLGAIVSVPMQIPDKGLLQGILVLFCAFVFQRGITYLAVKSHKIELLTQGSESLIIRDGVILTDELKKMKISREQMLAVLRNASIYNLGEIQRVYLEACGIFSIFKYDQPKPGLSLLPPSDEQAGHEFKIDKDLSLCQQCGNPAANLNETYQKCTNCHKKNWGYAVLAK
ncbi:uncharacterized membrane protein YcaP (DUF421 family) [Pedobacter sp. W3I1]|uniref:DUF421 domain-containing protein n=1 Tax=Pedobacter sp. W3I1 TaxID=3042291 RepID=UPI00278B344C|nr:YetF domain-containing protein [Pedobacter sp. W3I1]MDQ0638476.1 uncharacterized membrane protein YcaP (DUF421 family) [Pedobacter sp. W3I1]